MKNKFSYKRGEVYKIDFSDSHFIDQEQKGNRLGVIIQNDKGNKYSHNVIVALATSKYKGEFPTHVYLGERISTLSTTIIMTEHIRTVSKSRLYEYVCSLDYEEMQELDKKLKVSLALH